MPTDVMPRAARRAAGVYYTPRPLVDHVVAKTLGPLLEGETPARLKLRVVDPSCGRGAFLVGVYEFLLEWYLRHYVAHRPEAWAEGPSPALAATPQGWRLTRDERKRILLRHVFGVDIDADALAAAKAALAESLGPPSLLDRNLIRGDALLAPGFRADGLDWPGSFPGVFEAGGFDAVVGNPPWGQKGVALAKDPAAVRHLREQFPSSAGIFDLFRPFVELSFRLLRGGGRLGLVLPDIVLLKNYEPTRRLLLDHTTLDAIDWWGMRFDGATIDAATVVATTSAPAPAGHRVDVTVHDPRRPVAHRIGQDEFRCNPRCAFNLFLTPDDRALLDRLSTFPKLGDYFEAHEGIHSGNMRDELFVDAPLDVSCRPLLFGRDEIAPYRLTWRGGYVRLGMVARGSAVPPGGRYANVGRREWHEQPKVLVRRTGDRVIAAMDWEGRYASNNFFLVLPRPSVGPSALTLEGLCALLNSAFLTEHFRRVEPRRGRAFAELKIKHLAAFPLPLGSPRCGDLNRLGALRSSACESGDAVALDARIEVLVREMFRAARETPGPAGRR
jgi:hypothetical protein